MKNLVVVCKGSELRDKIRVAWYVQEVVAIVKELEEGNDEAK